MAPSDASEYDVLLLYKMAEICSARKLIARALTIGMTVASEESLDGTELLVKLGAPNTKLEQMAEQIKMDMMLEQGGHAEFTVADRSRFQRASEDATFTSLQRIRLIFAMLELGKEESGCEYPVDELLEARVLAQAVPLHEAGVSTGALMNRWVLKPLALFPDQPLDEVKGYFGERVALYFAFMQHLVRWLVLPSCVGLACLLGDVLFGAHDSLLSDGYSLFTLVWISSLAKAWRTKEARLAFAWGTSHFEAEERERPEFRGAARACGIYTQHGYFVPLDEEPEALRAHAPRVKQFAHEERARRIALSYLIVVPVASLTIAAVSSLLAYRTSLQLAFACAAQPHDPAVARPTPRRYLGPCSPARSSLTHRWGRRPRRAGAGPSMC